MDSCVGTEKLKVNLQIMDVSASQATPTATICALISHPDKMYSFYSYIVPTGEVSGPESPSGVSFVYLRIRAMVVSATRTDSSSGNSWMPFGNRRFSMMTESSLVSISYSNTLWLRHTIWAFIVKYHQQEEVLETL